MIITVSGAHSGIGKTFLVEKLLRQLVGWSAIKVTTIKKGPCPKEIACGVCERQEKSFTIISDAKTINQKGKDTQRMKQAGAKRVLWLRARPEGLRKGLKEALKNCKGGPGVIIEGTSVLRYVKPDLSLYIEDAVNK